MCPLRREQARRETQEWVTRRLPTADSIVEVKVKVRPLWREGEKVGHELMTVVHLCVYNAHIAVCVQRGRGRDASRASRRFVATAETCKRL